MIKTQTLTAIAAGALVLSTAATVVEAQTPYGATSSQSQSQTNSQQDTFGAILGALFGANGSSLDAEWIRGRRPLNTGRTQFETRVNTNVRSGALS